MRYQPLFLALLMAFATPAFAAKDNPKEKTAHAAQSGKTKPAGKRTEAPAAKKSDEGKADAEKAKKNLNKSKDKTNPARDTSEANNKTKQRQSKADRAANKAEKEDAKEKGASKRAVDSHTEGKTGSTKPTRTNATQKHKKEKAEQPERPSEKSALHKNVEKKDTAGKKSAAEPDSRASAVKEKGRRNNNDEPSPKKRESKNNSPDRNESGGKNTAKGSDAPELRAALSAASNDLEEKQALQKRTAAFLVRVNGSLKELQQTRSNLSTINRQQRDAWGKLQKLDTELSALKTEIGNTRAQISRFVTGSYKNSQPNAVALFLKNAEPGQKTRFLRYTRYINSANEQVVRDLAKQQKELAAQERKINTELGRLKKLQANAQAALAKQGVRNTAEQAESRRQTAQMAKDAKKAVNRKDNEQRLNNLLSDLDQQKAEQRKKEAQARKKAAEARLAAAEKARQSKAEEKAAAERAAMSNLTDEDMKLQAPQSSAYSPITAPNSFSHMQGRLKKPVNGILSGLFGHPRDNGDVWKGVFYSTPPAAVSSIASGSVVYAAPLEGYGNVVVIDHGDHYVSIYSGLSEMAVAKGYSVGTGSKIGTSGTLPDGEEGLYLEIRYNGQNMNPLSWVN